MHKLGFPPQRTETAQSEQLRVGRADGDYSRHHVQTGSGTHQAHPIYTRGSLLRAKVVGV